jgi:hypothetical protein
MQIGKRVALISILVSALLAVAKIVVGGFAGSNRWLPTEWSRRACMKMHIGPPLSDQAGIRFLMEGQDRAKWKRIRLEKL